MKILVINGPNINMLGIREVNIYGSDNYEKLLDILEKTANEENIELEHFQSNHEGAIVDKIQEAYKKFDGIVINPAAYTHTSVAILDALKAVNLPTVEVHISKVSEREDFRQVNFIRDYAIKSFDAYVGMSALLTTTMTNMAQINAAIKEEFPNTVTFIGGAPVTPEFAEQIGANYYTDGPQELVEILNKLSA